jgi:tyrosyl-tRNA synthetase
MAEIRRNLPHTVAAPGSRVGEALVATALASSQTDARRLLAANAISINGQKSSREQFEATDFEEGRLLLRRGKAYKDSAVVELG